MAIIDWPGFEVASFRWKRTPKAATFSSIFGSQSLVGAAPVWEVQLTGVPQYWKGAVSVSTFLETLDGYRNQLALWNLVQPVPAGSLRGSLTLGFSTSQGATNVWVNGGPTQAFKTLLKGDLVGIGSGLTQQVVRISQDGATDATGLGNFLVTTPVRNFISAGSEVVWNRPRALFRQQTLSDGIEFNAVVGQAWTLSLVEDWRT